MPPDDLLLLDRGYSAGWLVALLNQHAVKFCTRVDTNDGVFTCVREFVRAGAIERTVMLRAPNKQDALD